MLRTRFFVRLKYARFSAIFCKTHITGAVCTKIQRAEFLICVKQTADLLAWLAQKALRKTHSLRAHLAGICCVTLALEMLICEEQTPLSRATQALHLLRDMHSRRELKIENSCPSCFSCFSCLSCRSNRSNGKNRKNRGV